MRNKNSFLTKFDNMLMLSLPIIKGKGEDNFYCCGPDENTDKAIAGVFDGSGGIGSRTHKEMGGHTEAYLASRTLSGALYDWFHANKDRPVAEGKELADSIRAAFMTSYGVLKEHSVENTKIKGALVRSFPATATIVIAENHLDGIMLHNLWVGDSRIYLLDSRGLAQITTDDVETVDALENLTADGVMKNVVSADGNFVIHYKPVLITEPAIVFAASDGCYGYLPSPMEFEYEILDALCNAEIPYEFPDRLVRLFNDVAGDDCTMCIMSFMFGSFKDQKKKLRPRLEEIYNTCIVPLDYCRENYPEREREQIRKIWGGYRKSYERYLRNPRGTL